MSRRSLLFDLCIVIILVAPSLRAQERSSFGVYGDYSLNIHAADFQQLPGVPNCCPRFEQGNGGGIALGALYDLSLSSLLALQLRAGYQSLSGTLTTSEPTTVLHEGTATAGEFQHRLNAELGTIGIEPLLGVQAIGDLRVNLGLRAGVLLTKRYDQREEIVKPDGAGTFLDSLGRDTHSRVRNQFSGDIPQASSFQMALLGGVSYILPLNSRHTLFLSPEAIYSFGLTPIASGLKWHVNSLRLGVAITYSHREETEEPKNQEKK